MKNEDDPLFLAVKTQMSIFNSITGLNTMELNQKINKQEFVHIKTEEDSHFSCEKEYYDYLAELERERIAHENRTPEAIRQDACRKRRKTAKNYYSVWIRTGTQPPAYWIDGISEEILRQSRKDVIKENGAYARLRGWDE